MVKSMYRDEMKRYKCLRCGKVFINSYTWRRHGKENPKHDVAIVREVTIENPDPFEVML